MRAAEAEPDQPGGGEDDRVVAAFVELAQARVEVAAQRLEAQVGAQRGSWTTRRRLDVPTTAPCGSSASAA